jgi:hypothetical protein
VNDLIRPATRADLSGIMAVEQSWPPPARATADKFLARLERFPEGFHVLERDGALVATITACPCRYDPGAPDRFRNWNQVTNAGRLREVGETSECNALYIVSGVIIESARGGDVFERMIGAEVETARRLGLVWVLAGAVIPGYAGYCRRHGEVPAADYVFLRRGGRPLDPLLAMYERIGFHVPDRAHVRPDYFPDLASLNYAALVVRPL